MGKRKKQEKVIYKGESVCKTNEERERLFKLFQLFYEIDKRINATGNWPKCENKIGGTDKR